MDKKDEKKNNLKRKWDNFLGYVMIVGMLLAFILAGFLIAAGVSSLINGVPYIDKLIEIFHSVFGGILIYVLVFAGIVLVIVVMELCKEYPAIFIVIILLLVTVLPKGVDVYRSHSTGDGGYSQNQNADTQERTRWENFEKMSRLGNDYRDISDDYQSFTDEFVQDGGIFLEAENGVYYAFPKYTKEEIADSDTCTAMAGTAKMLFGYDESVSLGKFVEDLGLTSESEMDGNLTYKNTSQNGYYYVRIMSTDITNSSDPVEPGTWISVFQRIRQISPYGKLSSGQDSDSETVYFVQEGDRYHSDSSCSSLHDSDQIYECYIEDVPDGRKPCGICY